MATVLAGCQGDRPDDAPTESSNGTTGATDESSTGAEPDDSSTDADCDPGESIVTHPDGDATVSVALHESSSYDAPEAEVTLDVARVEFDGADVPTVAYETDHRLDLWTDDGRSSREFTILDEEPIPVGTYRGLRVYGTIVDAELEDDPDDVTASLADGEFVGDTFRTVFEAGGRKEYTVNVVRTRDDDGFEPDFSGKTTASWDGP